jgi:hypothetical protein
MVISRRKWLLVGFLGVVSLWGCSAGISQNSLITPADESNLNPTSTVIIPIEPVPLDPTNTPIAKTTPALSQPDVLSVSVNGEQGAYNFSVTISSPDEGCNQYADWWEVISQDGDLFYRRILLHSHVNEQPFTRSGGPVSIDSDTIVLVRAHMYPTGYGGLVMKGSVAGGFEPTELSADFASGLAETPPLPEGCNF